VVGGWRRLHNEKLHHLYASLNIVRVIKSRRMRWAEHVTCRGKMRNVYKIGVQNLSLGRPRHRWQDNMSKNPREIEWEGVDGINLA
jgi:hypothetical protein